MKLELKHLTPYLPYAVKVKHASRMGNIKKIATLTVPDMPWLMNHVYLKPILRPLSDLTEEIEVNGKHFIPCYHWDHSNTEQDTYCDRIIAVASDPSSVEYLDYFIVEKLFEWHFDIFGLIEARLAVDINTVKF